MKKVKFIISVLLITFIAVSIFSSVLAVDTDDITIDVDVKELEDEIESANIDESSKVCNSDLYVIYGENDDSNVYTMDYYVEGNAFIIADNVKITGQVNGSLYVIANEIELDEEAYIADSLYAVADKITINGFTYDIYAVSEYFELGESAYIYRDVKVLSTEMYLRGVIGRNLIANASTIDVYDEESDLYVGGNIEYSSESEIENIDKITVEGEVTFKLTEEEELTARDIIYNYIYKTVQNIIYTLIIFLILLFVTPKFVEKSKEYMNTRAVLAGAIGLCFTILVPIVVIIVLFVTGAFSIAALLLMIYAIILMINSAVVNIVITEFLSEKIEWINNIWKKILMLVIVSLVIFICRQLPYIGTIITVIIFLVGVGIPILYQFDKRKKE